MYAIRCSEVRDPMENITQLSRDVTKFIQGLDVKVWKSRFGYQGSGAVQKSDRSKERHNDINTVSKERQSREGRLGRG